MKLTIPFPPPASRYWDEACVNKHVRRSVSRDGRIYQDAVRQAWMDTSPEVLPSPLDGPLRVVVEAHHPDARERKMTDLLRIAVDAMQHAGVFAESAVFWSQTIDRAPVAPGGFAVVHLVPFSPAAAVAPPGG